MSREELIKELNMALEIEHSAIMMYMHHAEFVKGLNAEPIIARLKEIAGDEEKHRNMLRERITALGGVPSTKLSSLEIKHGNAEDMLKDELKEEIEAVQLYREILETVKKLKDLEGSETLYHAIYHLIQGEQEHVEELKRLLGK